MDKTCLVWSLSAALSFGCATGTPVGRRQDSLATHYRARGDSSPAPDLPARPRHPAAAAQLSDSSRETVVAAARRLVGSQHVRLNGRRYSDDCTGFVRAVYDQAGVDLFAAAGSSSENGVTSIYRYALARGRVFKDPEPEPGDLVFFRETYDQNRDGRINDGLTHVGVVERVLSGGTVVIIHRVSRGVVRYRMNLSRPSVHQDPVTHQALNDYLRTSGFGRREVLTGQLFAAYGAVLPGATRVANR